MLRCGLVFIFAGASPDLCSVCAPTRLLGRLLRLLPWRILPLNRVRLFYSDNRVPDTKRTTASRRRPHDTLPSRQAAATTCLRRTLKGNPVGLLLRGMRMLATLPVEHLRRPRREWVAAMTDRATTCRVRERRLLPAPVVLGIWEKQLVLEAWAK